ncbi:MAG: hypothetical protein E7017_02510 [Alphaproteobacteria bacterium]|nr:hypothetical protein [Alphaproteobacteria bacterium]
MKKFDVKNSLQKGSMMVEALAMLGLITMVTPILYKKAAERTTELQDINVATQMRMVSSAVDQFISDNYYEIGDAHGTEKFKLSAEEIAKLEKYLPHGFDIQKSKMFKDFEIAVRKREVEDKNGIKHNIFTSAVLAPLRDNLAMARSSKIASMIGANGGVYRKIGEEHKLNGVQGTWEATLGDYGLDGAYKDGSLVIISTDAISAATGDVTSDQALYRTDEGDMDKNRMQTTLYMGGNNVEEVVSLIASASGGNNDTVYIGKKGGGDDSNLWVTGTSNLVGAVTTGTDMTVGGNLLVNGTSTLTGNVDAKANVNIAGNLDVDGDTTLDKTTVNGDFLQDSGSAKFAGNSFTVEVQNNGSIKMNTGGSTTIGGKVVDINGNDRVKMQAGNNYVNVAPAGNEINGPTTFKSDVTMEKNLSVGGDVTVGGNITVEKDVTADWLYAKSGIKVGGTDGQYFEATASGTAVKGKNFAVGGSVGSGERINTNDSSAYIGVDYATMGSQDGLMVQSGSLVLRNANGDFKINSSDGVLLSQGSNARFQMKGTSASLKIGASGSETSIFEATNSKIGITGKGADGKTPASMYLEGGAMKLTNNKSGMIIDEYGLRLDVKDNSELANPSIKTEAWSGASFDPAVRLPDTAAVTISRKGIIELNEPTDANSGYIRARRLVSDIKYPTDDAYHGVNVLGNKLGDGEKYDYYQVNPAYTSVMNDIKLASRGGARLSDILPDFINKGIYIADNTYENSSVGNWEGMEISGGKPSSNFTSCGNASCIASPWLGFVPAPQCPPYYAKVITINPIRWRMSEAFSVYDTTEGLLNASKSDYEKIVFGDNFKTVFDIPTDPKFAPFEISVPTSEDPHKHILSFNPPLSFQTNTWLNTSIQPHDQGWHAIMGFIYRPKQYKDVLVGTGSYTAAQVEGMDSDVILWNLFPVYAQDMAAVINVYCYFERNPSNNGSRSWTWGEAPAVYKYDQLNNYHDGHKKDDTWSSQVNDPKLGYKDAW